jgi:glucosamine-6-phosphate deaminase
MAEMKLFIVPSESFAQAAADHVVARVQEVATSGPLNIGTATGGTMEGIYRHLVTRALRDSILLNSLRQASYFAMDEYVGKAPNDPQSYSYFMHTHLLCPLSISQRLTLPGETTARPSESADDESSVYDQIIANRGGIKIQFAGIGENGHLAFNEPGSEITSWTRRVQLSESTIEANARFFLNRSEVPREAYTMGIQTILNAESVILFACGRKKAKAVQRMIKGPSGSDCPASFLLNHRDVTVFLDWDAAADLRT